MTATPNTTPSVTTKFSQPKRIVEIAALVPPVADAVPEVEPDVRLAPEPEDNPLYKASSQHSSNKHDTRRENAAKNSVDRK